MVLPADVQACLLAWGIQPQGLLHQNDKSLVAWGLMGGRKVVIKVLLSAEARWAGRCCFEADVLKYFQKVPPPFDYAPLIYVGERVLVLGFIEGQHVTRDRYPEIHIPSDILVTTLDELKQIADWVIPAAHPFKVLNYAQKIAGYMGLGLLSENEAAFIQHTLETSQNAFTLQHGDTLFSNMLYQQNKAVFVDWEHAGLFLPGYDLALLHTLCWHDAKTRKVIEAFAHRHEIWQPFLANKSIILARETKQHQNLADNTPFKQKRLKWLHDEQTRHRQALPHA